MFFVGKMLAWGLCGLAVTIILGDMGMPWAAVAWAMFSGAMVLRMLWVQIRSGGERGSE